jgi:hypothetical protein
LAHGSERASTPGPLVMSRGLAETTHLLPLDEDAGTLKP